MIALQAFKPKHKIDSFETNDKGFAIQARKVGIIAWFLSVIGLGAKTFLEANAKGVTIRSSSFSGDSRAFVPIAHVAATVFQFGRPVGLLVMGIVLTLSGAIQAAAQRQKGPGIAVLAIGIVLMLAYKFSSKTATLGVISDAGTVDTLRLRASESEVEQLRSASLWLEGAVSASPSRQD